MLIHQRPIPGLDSNRLVVCLEPDTTGGAARVLNNIFRSAGIKKDGLNIISCDNDSDISFANTTTKTRALEIINSRKWNRIDLVGETALRWFTDKRGVAKWRGSPLDVQGQRGMAIFDPLYLMRDQSMLPVTANDLTKSLVEPPEHYKPFPSIEEVRAFTATTFAFDIECPKYRTMGETAPAEMVGLCASATEAICVPVRGEYHSELKRIFRNAKAVIGHNCIQFDLPKLEAVDITIKPECQVWDTMLLQHLRFPDMPHDLEFVGSQFVSKPAWKQDKDAGWEPYCCRDTDVTYQVWLDLLPMVTQEGLLDLYNNVQIPLARICYLMHETGFKVNPARISEVREKLLKELDELEKELPDFLRGRDEPTKKRIVAPPGTLGKSGKPVKYLSVPTTKRIIPWRSSAIKQRYLYGDGAGCLGLEPVYDLKSGRITTGKMAIAKLYGKTKNHAILALGKINKIDETITTFAKADMLKISRMYPHFNVHGTASGRLSSSDPNLQNIPEPVRCIYVPSHAGWKIIDVDYSNIENRLTAILAGDNARLAKYADPKYSDYKLLVSRAYGIPEDEVIKDNSREAPYGRCKAIVLGINYGLGAKKISKMYDIPLPEVYRLLDVWKSEIKGTIAWQTRTASQASRDGVLTTPFNRKRWFWTSSAYTESLSFLPQSCAADIIFRAMLGLMYERIGWDKAKILTVTPIVKSIPSSTNLLLQVHDSLVFESAPDKVDELVDTLKLVMEQPWKELGGYSIPISVKIGEAWG